MRFEWFFAILILLEGDKDSSSSPSVSPSTASPSLRGTQSPTDEFDFPITDITGSPTEYSSDVSTSSPTAAPDDLPDCIHTMLEQISSEPVWNPPAKLVRYEIQDTVYYYFPTRCCDIMSELFDEQCQLICHPNGGIIGIGDGKCPDHFDRWDESAVVVWEDERT